MSRSIRTATGGGPQADDPAAGLLRSQLADDLLHLRGVGVDLFVMVAENERDDDLGQRARSAGEHGALGDAACSEGGREGKCELALWRLGHGGGVGELRLALGFLAGEFRRELEEAVVVAQAGEGEADGGIGIDGRLRGAGLGEGVAAECRPVDAVSVEEVLLHDIEGGVEVSARRRGDGVLGTDGEGGGQTEG